MCEGRCVYVKVCGEGRSVCEGVCEIKCVCEGVYVRVGVYVGDVSVY